MTIRSYKELFVWQKAMRLVSLVYTLTKQFPSEERFGLTSQIRRSAVSVPSNIAEGQARNSTAEFKNFLSIARGSLAELETQLLIARDLDYLGQKQLDQVMVIHTEVSKMIPAIRKKLNA